MEREQKNVANHLPNEDGIDFIAIALKLWEGRTTLLKTIAIGSILGIIIALLSPKQYTATSTIVPQLGNETTSKLGGLGGLAALAGINIDMSQQASSDLSPLVYPQIVSSVPFQLELMQTPLNYEDFPHPVTLYDYLVNLKKPTILGTISKYTIGLPGIIIKALRKKKESVATISENKLVPLALTESQIEIQKMLNEAVVLDIKPKDGYLTIIVKLDEPLATAQMALRAQNLLQKYIIDFKTQKAQANLDFIQGSYSKAKKEFEQAQVKLAVANDRSKGFTSGLAQVETDRLQSEYTITFGVYQELAKQFEQAKIQVKKETPVFTVVEPPTVPFERTKPKRTIMVLIWSFLGGVVGTGIILGKEYWNTLLIILKEVQSPQLKNQF